MSQKVCCVPGCSTVAGDGISLHRFPNPNQHIDLFQVWLKKIGGHVAELDKDYIYSNRRVCRRHFEDIYLYPTKLCSLAIPSLCLAENMAAAEAIIVSEPHTSSSFISNSNEMEMAPDNISKMKAVVFDGKSLTLKYDENYPMPVIQKDDDVIVKVEYSGVCGTDLHIIQGEFPASKERPLPLGHEFSGVVHQAGKASIFKVGQKIVVDPNRACNLCSFCRDGKYQYCLSAGINSTIGIWKDGGWAQYCRCPQDQVYALPEGITTEQAGLCEPYSCVAHGYDRAAPLPIGSKILIVGAGIIGNLWITTLHLQGHKDVTVSEMNKSRLDIVKLMETGYRLVTPDVLAAEKQLYDVIIDCTGVGKVMEISFNYLQHGGKYVLFGCCPPTHQASLNPYQIYDKELTIIGVKINPFSFPKAIGLLQAMGDRYLNYEKLGVKTYPLSAYQDAIKALKAGSISKAIFKIV